MYVKWTWLSYMAALMWTSLVVHDKYFLDAQRRELKYNLLDEPNIFDKPESPKTEASIEPIKMAISSLPLTHFTPELSIDTSSWITRFWNVIAFILSVASCILIRAGVSFAINYFWKNSVAPQALSVELRTGRNSKIPMLQFKKSNSDIAIGCSGGNGNADGLELRKSFSEASKCVNIITSEITKELLEYKKKFRAQERMCSQLRQELMDSHDDREKERETLHRKLETASTQKRELSKQLAAALKDNGIAQVELKELYAEKKVHERKLELTYRDACASQQTKRAQARQIEDLRTENKELKRRVQKVVEENDEYEAKLQTLQQEFFQLKLRKNKSLLNMAGPIQIQQKPERLERHVDDGDSLTPVSRPSDKTLKAWNDDRSLSDEAGTTVNKTEFLNKVQRRLQNLEHTMEHWDERRRACDELLPKIANLSEGSRGVSESFHTCCANTESGSEADAGNSIINEKRFSDDKSTGFSSNMSTMEMSDQESGASSAAFDSSAKDSSEVEVNFDEELERLRATFDADAANSCTFNPAAFKTFTQPQIAVLKKYFETHATNINSVRLIDDVDAQVYMAPNSDMRTTSSSNGSQSELWTDVASEAPETPCDDEQQQRGKKVAAVCASLDAWSQRIVSDSPAFKSFLHNFKPWNMADMGATNSGNAALPRSTSATSATVNTDASTKNDDTNSIDAVDLFGLD